MSTVPITHPTSNLDCIPRLQAQVHQAFVGAKFWDAPDRSNLLPHITVSHAMLSGLAMLTASVDGYSFKITPLEDEDKKDAARMIGGIITQLLDAAAYHGLNVAEAIDVELAELRARIGEE